MMHIMLSEMTSITTIRYSFSICISAVTAALNHCLHFTTVIMCCYQITVRVIYSILC